MRNQVKLGARTLRLALASTAVAATLFSHASHAAIVVVDLTASPLAIPNNFAGIYLNVVTGASGITQPSTPGWDINPFGSGGNLSFFTPTGGGIVGSTGTATALLPGATVSAASTFVTGTATGTPFRVTGTEYLGFRFQNESTGVINYGYVQMTTTGPSGFPAAIAGYAYENTGLGITVTPVPEPATTGMMLAGGLGLWAWRRRRSVQ